MNKSWKKTHTLLITCNMILRLLVSLSILSSNALCVRFFRWLPQYEYTFKFSTMIITNIVMARAWCGLEIVRAILCMCYVGACVCGCKTFYPHKLILCINGWKMCDGCAYLLICCGSVCKRHYGIHMTACFFPKCLKWHTHTNKCYKLRYSSLFPDPSYK